MHPLLHRTRPRFRILDLDVCSLKGDDDDDDKTQIFYHYCKLLMLLYMRINQVPELGDTVFIVLRKQQLIFLHWYVRQNTPPLTK